MIQRDLATTGDGLLTGLHLCDAVLRHGRSVTELAAVMERLPQVLRNVRLGSGRADVGALLQRLEGDVATAEARLGAEGRVLLRPSGTEPLIRVMVEAATHDEADAVAGELARAVEAAGA